MVRTRLINIYINKYPCENEKINTHLLHHKKYFLIEEYESLTSITGLNGGHREISRP